MKRRFGLWPPSLATQLISLTLAAIIISQAFALWLFTDERRLALMELAAGTVVSRTAALVELLDESPPQLHEQIRNAASSPLLYYWISEKPLLQHSGKERVNERILKSLQRLLGDGRQIRTDAGRDIEIPHYRPHRDRREDREGGKDRVKPRERLDRPPPPRYSRNVPLVFAMSIQLDDGNWLNMAADLSMPRGSLFRTMLAAGLMAVGVILVIAFTVRRLTKPLRRLAEAADALGRGDDPQELKEAGPPEVRSAIYAFNVMRERLTRFITDRTAMLAAISHDLRTPITSLRIRAEFIDDEENRDKMIATLDEMQRMVEATLSFARDEAQREALGRVNLAEFLDAIVADYQDMGQPVSLAIPDHVARTVVSCRPIAIRRALRNLIDNALRYGEEARVGFTPRTDGVEITVTDSGPGIPEERLNDIFEPFVRLETSRSEETGGIGLGLAIARSSVQAHGGALTLANNKGGGLTAKIMLPS
ncbi:HAMP domain-containing protein [Hoeflea sp. WL0058]|uniref:histidine kinase n=1 Tax=Flavimaribacter sediminis TaxID=2865987 RepID=A0AAE2ZRT4_9HYPH|nr:ATP-binding protein [Flavimaribacter sediminis]MBW8639781.1 HAMP domain-containing protein [Flavimaribacter sediminis]